MSTSRAIHAVIGTCLALGLIACSGMGGGAGGNPIANNLNAGSSNQAVGLVPTGGQANGNTNNTSGTDDNADNGEATGTGPSSTGGYSPGSAGYAQPLTTSSVDPGKLVGDMPHHVRYVSRGCTLARGGKLRIRIEGHLINVKQPNGWPLRAVEAVTIEQNPIRYWDAEKTSTIDGIDGSFKFEITIKPSQDNYLWISWMDRDYEATQTNQDFPCQDGACDSAKDHFISQVITFPPTPPCDSENP